MRRDANIRLAPRTARTGKGDSEKKRLRNDIPEDSRKKKKEAEEIGGRSDEHQDAWSKVVGRKERRRSVRDGNINNNSDKRKEKEKTRPRKLLKTSAVVITTGDKNVSYSEILA